MNSATIARVQEGMRVVDATGEQVGKVAYVKMGDPEAVTTQGNEPIATGLTERFADVVAPKKSSPIAPVASSNCTFASFRRSRVAAMQNSGGPPRAALSTTRKGQSARPTRLSPR